MNLSEYIVLAAVAVAVAFGQQAEQNNLASETISVILSSSKANLDAGVFPNATLILQSGYMNATKCVAKSQTLITNAISKARDLLPQDPGAAKNLLHHAFQDGRIILLTCGIPAAFSYGTSLALSNEGALQGIKDARKSVVGAGFSALDAIDSAEVLLIAGIGFGSNTSHLLLDACQLAVETGFAGCYNYLQISIQEGDQGLRDAQSKPIEGQVEDRNCEYAGDDSAILEAIKDINDSASKAMKNCADTDLVETMREDLICILVGHVNLTGQIAQSAETMKKMAETDPLAFKIAYFKLIEQYTNKSDDLFSKIYFGLGKIVFKVGMQTSNRLGEAVIALEEAQIKIHLATINIEALVSIGVQYGGGGSNLAIDSAVKIGAFLQTDVAQALVKCANLVFSEL